MASKSKPEVKKPTVTKPKTTIKKPKLKAAVIGGGNMGKNHLRNYFLLPDVQLVALADISEQTKELADEYKAKHYTDYLQMLDDEKPDIISIVVPTPLHHRVASEAMKRKIHVLLEKPVASTVEEADELIALAEEHGVVFTVGHIEHYNPVVRKLKELIDQKKLGEITSVVAKRVGGFPAVEPKTDVIIDLAVHDIGIINYLLDKDPIEIYCHGSRTHHSKEIDSAEILMDYGQESGFIQANWLTPVKIRTIAVTGSAGYVEANYITQQLEYYEHNMKSAGQPGFGNFVNNVGEPTRQIISVDFEEPLARELKSFIATVRGAEEIMLVHPMQAREALRLALKAIEPYTSQANGAR